LPPAFRIPDVPAPSWLRRLLRAAAWAAVGLYFAVGLLVLVVRHAVLPGIEGYRGDIEAALSAAFARPVAIRAIDAQWRGLWPSLRIQGLDIRDAEGRSALGFDNVEVDLAWSSLWHLEPRFARLELIAPSLEIRRDAAGRLFVAGLEIDPAAEGGGFSDWLLVQDRVVIRNAAVTWHDELRRAPPLVLARLNVDLRNSGNRHRFGLTADPPRQLAARLDIRGDFRGRDLEALAAWRGEAYAELDYADLAGWQAWVDYPLELPRGRGGLRLWLGIDNQRLDSLTADVRLSDVALRLAPELPMLELERVDGRIAGQRLAAGFAGTVKRLTLAARGGIRVEPTDLDLHWTPGTDTVPARGEANASQLDLGALGALAGHLPLERNLRQRLAAFAPQGRLEELKLAWAGGPDRLSAYSFKARFADLGLNAQGAIPGFAGLDGRIEGSEKGGSLELDSTDAAIDLPAVFPERRLGFSALAARADWKVEGGAVDVRLERASFENADAAGEASGRYRGDGASPGTIDLSARLSRAQGGAVWRYMPLVVNQDTRDWLRRSIVGGAATASLRLKGDLYNFPFADGSGIFEVKGPFHGASLDYAPGWPRFEDVTGDLTFVGARMVIRAQSARLWGVTLADVKAEIPDLGAPEELMTITGSARGPTGDFLRFIEASPVGDRIDHFTEDMRATGNGELRLRLDMPLRRIADTRVDGHYRFAGNGLVYDADMPPLADINGELRFTGDRLEAQRIRAMMLGAPMSLDVATVAGRVEVKAAGSLQVRNLRQLYGHRLFEHLSGSAPWTGSIRVKKRAAEVRIESSLQGVSSSLPEPFNKTAATSLPLVVERKPPPEVPRPRRPAGAEGAPADRDQLVMTLGDVFRLQLVRRHEADQAVIERGLVAVGAAEARLPEQGVAVAVRAGQVDVDFWRGLAVNGGNGSNGGIGSNGGAGGGLPVQHFELQAGELTAQGRALKDVQLSGDLQAGTWKLDLKSREAAGRLDWNGAGAGRLSGHLAHLTVPESGGTDETGGIMEATDPWPAIDLAVDRFRFRGMDLGALRLKAENAEGTWSAHFDASSDDGHVQGDGRWRPGPTQTETHLDFKLSAKSVEKLLARFGYPNTVRRGTATLDGQLTWAGPPAAIDYRSLNGRLNLTAAGGQFNKLEPGVGRLLGIVSLQSLPRRISLDFRDIFTEGFAFDSITGQFAVKQGVMETRDMQIQGPAAKVLMNGSVDLSHETQDLKVRVQPALGETVATGVLLASPAVGAAAWVMNKLFGNPLDKAFAFDYSVTGSWADPKVEKLSAQGPAASAQP
jgi:uncharacterized protein (TIGR02099 family)